VRPAGPGPTDHSRNMIGDHGTPEVHIVECFHQFIHVRVTVVHEGFDKVRYRRADVAEVNLPELVHFGEGAGSFKDIPAHLLAAFHPGPRAETDADVGTIGDLQSADVAIE